MVTGSISANPYRVGFCVVNTQWGKSSVFKHVCQKEFQSLEVVRFGPVRYGPQVYTVCIDWLF